MIQLPALNTATVTVLGQEFELTELSALDRTVVLEIFAGADPENGDVFSSDFHARCYACAVSLAPEAEEDELQALQEQLMGSKGTLVDELYPHVAELTGLHFEKKLESLVESSGGD